MRGYTMNKNVTNLLKKLLVLSLAVATAAPLCAMEGGGGGQSPARKRARVAGAGAGGGAAAVRRQFTIKMRSYGRPDINSLASAFKSVILSDNLVWLQELVDQ